MRESMKEIKVDTGYTKDKEGISFVLEILKTIKKDLHALPLTEDIDTPIEQLERLNNCDWGVFHEIENNKKEDINITLFNYFRNLPKDDNIKQQKKYISLYYDIYNKWDEIHDNLDKLVKEYNKLVKETLKNKDGYEQLPAHIDTARRNWLFVCIVSLAYVTYGGEIKAFGGVDFKTPIPECHVLRVLLVFQLYFGIRFIAFLTNSELDVFIRGEWKQAFKNIFKWNDVSKRVVFRIFNFYIPLLIGVASVIYTLLALYKLYYP